MGRSGVPNDVGERLSERAQQMGCDLIADRGIDRSVKLQMRFEAESSCSFADQREDLPAESPPGSAGSLKGEDGGPDLPDGLVQIGDGRFDTGGRLGGVDDREGSLKRESGGEQPLDYRVVQVGCDARPIFDQGDVPYPGVEPCVVYRHRCRTS